MRMTTGDIISFLIWYPRELEGSANLYTCSPVTGLSYFFRECILETWEMLATLPFSIWGLSGQRILLEFSSRFGKVRRSFLHKKSKSETIFPTDIGKSQPRIHSQKPCASIPLSRWSKYVRFLQGQTCLVSCLPFVPVGFEMLLAEITMTWP